MLLQLLLTNYSSLVLFHKIKKYNHASPEWVQFLYSGIKTVPIPGCLCYNTGSFKFRTYTTGTLHPNFTEISICCDTLRWLHTASKNVENG